MVSSITNIMIYCDGCGATLEHPETSSVISFRGTTVYEDTDINIKIVAKDYGWDINDLNHLCTKCKKQ